MKAFEAMTLEQENLPSSDALYQLNIGDFVIESFISEALLHKIQQRMNASPDRLKNQLEELIQIYSLDKTLAILGLDTHLSENHLGNHRFLYDSILRTLRFLFQVDACHWFAVGPEAWRLLGTSSGTLVETSSGTLFEGATKPLSEAIPAEFMPVLTKLEPLMVVENVDALSHWQPCKRLGQHRTQAFFARTLKLPQQEQAVLLWEWLEPHGVSPELLALAEATTTILETALSLQERLEEAKQALLPESNPAPEGLKRLRSGITQRIAELEDQQWVFVEALAHAMDARYQFSKGHSQQVAHWAQKIAQAMDLNEKTVDLVYMAGLVGSLGKLAWPSSLLTKPQALSPAEWDLVQHHPNYGMSVLAKIYALGEVLPYIQSQNERWDGSGSPEGLSGKNIPLGSRILAVANAFCAMTHDRPYRDGRLSPSEAMAMLQKEAGSKWDPAVIAALQKNLGA